MVMGLPERLAITLAPARCAQILKAGEVNRSGIGGAVDRAFDALARVYARMDLEESNLEEHSYYVIHRTRCLGLGLGVRIRPEEAADGDDNYTVWFRIWPLAIPGFSSSLGG